MFHIFYSTYADASMYQGSSCRGFTLLLRLLKVRTAYLILARICRNYYFYSDDFWLKCDVCETGRQFPIISFADEGLGEMCFPAGLPIHSFSLLKSLHIWRYKDILSRKSSHIWRYKDILSRKSSYIWRYKDILSRKVRIKTYRFL